MSVSFIAQLTNPKTNEVLLLQNNCSTIIGRGSIGLASPQYVSFVISSFNSIEKFQLLPIRVSRKHLEVNVNADSQRISVKNVTLLMSFLKCISQQNYCQIGRNFILIKGARLLQNEIMEVVDGDTLVFCEDASLVLSISTPTLIQPKIEDADDGDHDSDRTENDSALEDNSTSILLKPVDFSDESEDICPVESENEEEKEENKAEKKIIQRKRLKVQKEIKSETEVTESSDGEVKKTKRRGKSVKSEPRKKPTVTAYGLYSRRVRAKVKKENPDLDTSSITGLIKKNWASLSEEEQQVYIDLAISKNDPVYVPEEKSDSEPPDYDPPSIIRTERDRANGREFSSESEEPPKRKRAK
ncbi:hypothetical protein HK098_001876 [Nowakowskiella sp. JEL0407]|nr:hypothetical protein HK098_001876 [Nowakowskiella sp. JEL0407]